MTQQPSDQPRVRKKTGPKGPTKPIDDKDFEMLIGLIEIQCTAEEICGVLGMCEDTLNKRIEEQNIPGIRNFSELYKRHAGAGRTSLRRAQWKAAHDGNPTMLIWLGKQMLGQRDKQEITGADGGPIQQQHSGKVAINLKNLTDEELDALEATLSKAVEGDAA